MRTVIVIALSIAVVLGLKFWRKGDDSSDVKKSAHLLIQQFEDYQTQKDYYDQSFELAHPKAFDDAYSIGGRRTSSKLDVDLYFAKLLSYMELKARQDQKEDFAERFALLRNEMESEKNAKAPQATEK